MSTPCPWVRSPERREMERNDMKASWVIVILSLIAHGLVVIARWHRKRGQRSQPTSIDERELGVA